MTEQRARTAETAGEPDEAQRAEHLRASFREAFGTEAEFVARAPGRVNLIGEHTDYNGGYVLPAAIDRTLLVAARAVPDSRTVELFSLNYNKRATFDLDNIEPSTDKSQIWSNYVRAVAWALGHRHLLDLSKVPGAQIAIEGNVPRASGLSSSAAIEVASALAFTCLAGVDIARVDLALVCQFAENEFIGVKSGIMDQFISALGQTDSALLVDTRSLAYEVVPLRLEELGYKVVAVDSAVPRSLITSAYNQRRTECEQAVRILAPLLDLGRGAQLRDVSLAQLEEHKAALPDLLYRRAHHVITENDRTLRAAALMRDGLGNESNLEQFGKLLYRSHESLRDDYEVSSAQLDLLVELARETPGVAGARMTGAGFGGCTVNIVDARYLAQFEERVVQEYRRRTGLDARLYVCKAVEGGSFV